MSGQPFLYGCEGWTISNTMRTRLEATELWFLMRISWTDKLTNDAVLLKADTQRSLLKVITSRQIRFLGHVLRKNELEAIALTGKIEGKRARGRQRKMFFGLGVICMWKPMDRSRDSEAVPETRGAPVDRQRQILIWHYNRTGH